MFSGATGKLMMIQQGYVPSTCTLPDEIAGPVIWREVNRGVSPCAGCNGDRLVCKGNPRDPNYDAGFLPAKT